MNKYFHESEDIISMCMREWTSISSLGVMPANALNHACEMAIQGIWDTATGVPFPKDDFKPYHKPLSCLKKIGVLEDYSEKSQTFLEQLNGMALDEARYVDTQAYKVYTNPKSAMKGVRLIEGTETFISETKELSRNERVLERIRIYKSENNK